MPQELFVLQLEWVVSFVLTLSGHLKNIKYLNFMVLLSVVEIGLDHFVFIFFFFKGAEFTIQRQILFIDGVHFGTFALFLFLDNVVCNFNIYQILNEIKFLLEHLFGFDSEITHVLHAEVVRDVGVEFT
jgi:hypothetical protein